MISREITEKIQILQSDYTLAEIGRILHISYPTVLKYSRQESISKVPVSDKLVMKPYVSSDLIIPFTDDIDRYMRSGLVSSRKLEYLLRQKGYKGSYQTLHKHVRRIRIEQTIKKTDAYFRVETPAGEQAQVDWGYFGKIPVNGEKVRLYGFVYVLSYSRAMYAEFVLSQRQKTLQDCHIHAFQYLGGIPKKIRYDNMKTVVISRKKLNGQEVANWNFDFKNFAHYFKFEPELCPRYYPRSKGKVEARVKYFKTHFFHGEAFGKTFKGIDELNERLREWLDTHANKQEHPFHKKRYIQEFWNEEKKSLIPMSSFGEFSNIAPQVRRVSGVSMVSYKSASYWVPKEHVHQKVEIREVIRDGSVFLEFHAKAGKIAEHLLAPSGSWILPDDQSLIKTKGKKDDIENRVKQHPIYNLQIDIRELDYYQKLL
ncbi:MAG: IS21 family transposase [Candidatus Kerfeldbacteria bacterium]|nr:IS21 family transposase [Candidatus Kerfeldbacteria bacterium]